MPERCRTRYPLLLAHGLNCRDHWPLDYWGRIPEALRAEGRTKTAIYRQLLTDKLTLQNLIARFAAYGIREDE